MYYFNQMIFPYQMQLVPMAYYDMEQQRARWNNNVSLCNQVISKIFDKKPWNEQQKLIAHILKEVYFNSLKR